MKKMRSSLLCLVMSVTLITSLTGCNSQSAGDQSGQDQADQPPLSMSDGSVFAVYQEVPVNIDPTVTPYQVSPGLANVINKDQFAFSEEAQTFLVKNGFVVIPTSMREFFMTYELNRYDMTPNFITTDAMLHNYHLYFSHLLRTLEKNSLRGELDSLTSSLLESSQKQYEALKGTEWENAAKRNVAFFAVAAELIGQSPEIPSYVSSEVNSELELIADHQETFTAISRYESWKC